MKTPSKKKRKGRKKEEQYETEGTDDSERESSSKKKNGKRKLSLDDESFSEEEKPKYKGKGKGKGKGKSSLPAKRSRREPVQEEADDSASDDDVPISKRRERPKSSPQKRSHGRFGTKSKTKSSEEEDELSSPDSEEEAIEDTPEESSEVDEDLPGFKEDKLFLKNKKRRRSTSDSDPREGNSRNARPKRSAKARVIKDDSESDQEHEAKVPYRRKIVPKSTDGPSGSGVQRKSSGNSESGSRPSRQATEKALSKFESGFSTEEDFPPRNKPLSASPKKTLKKSSDSTDPRPRRHAREKRSFKIQDDTESEDSVPEPVLPIARKSRPPPPPSPIHHNAVSSSNGVQTDAQQPGPSSAGVTIPAADSSTNPSRSTKRNARTASKFPSSIHTEPNSPEDQSLEGASEPGLNEGGSSSRRPQRKIVKPIRLQDYSDDDELREAKRKNGAPLDQPKPEKKKKPKKKKRSVHQKDSKQDQGKEVVGNDSHITGEGKESRATQSTC